MAGDHPPKTLQSSGSGPSGPTTVSVGRIAACGASATPTTTERRQMIVSVWSSMRAIRIASEPPASRACDALCRRVEVVHGGFGYSGASLLGLRRRPFSRRCSTPSLAPPRPPAPPRAGASRRHPHHASAAVGPARLPESARRSHGTREESGSGRQSSRADAAGQAEGGRTRQRRGMPAPRPTPPVVDPASADASGLPARFTRPASGHSPFLRRRT